MEQSLRELEEAYKQERYCILQNKPISVYFIYFLVFLTWAIPVGLFIFYGYEFFFDNNIDIIDIFVVIIFGLINLFVHPYFAILITDGFFNLAEKKTEKYNRLELEKIDEKYRQKGLNIQKRVVHIKF